jgi:lipoprotein-anchoring transpeptidase ErfK/SrfK
MRRAFLSSTLGLFAAALAVQACGGKVAPEGGAPTRSSSASFQAAPAGSGSSGAYVVASGAAGPGHVIPAGSTSASADDAKLLQAMEGAGGPTAAPAASGPQVGILSQQAQVYAGPSSREARIGYLRRGARTPSDGVLVPGPGCSEGWYKLNPYGYVCGKNATSEVDSPKVRLGAVPANLTDILPYRYARNVHHGTPMYRHLPTHAEMIGYEPYLRREGDPEPEPTPTKQAVAPPPETAVAPAPEKPKVEKKAKKKGKKKKKKKGKAESADAAVEKIDDTPVAEPAKAETPPPLPAAAPTASATVAEVPSLLGTGGAGGDLPDAGTLAIEDAGPPKPWWRRKLAEGEKPEIKLADLTEDADKLLVRRMVQGFYVAVDRTFSANNRLFHHTTLGLLAPADRMSLVKAPDLSGQEIDEPHAANAVGFVLAKTPTEFSFDEKGAIKAVGQKKRYDRSFLTGKTRTHGGGGYHETVDGTWLRDRDITWTEPGKPPADLAPNEKWIDVNLTTGTLVAFEGARAVFATLVSTGKKSTIKEKDHRTPTGTWRVREKHVAATMDGDGAAAGDLPYSIEDVPYIQYFFESYALHAAFWHDNFGRQQSHGCVNLAPLDAKRLFFWSDPPLPSGWHGVQSTAEHPGSRVVVHD